MKMPKTKTCSIYNNIEFPTLFLIAMTYCIWFSLVFILNAVSLWLIVPLMGLVLTFHSSLQHEAIHGHPIPNEMCSTVLVYPPIGLWIPYERFKELHIKHHKNEIISNPQNDPETNYIYPENWKKIPYLLQKIMCFNNTLFGYVFIKTIIKEISFICSEIKIIYSGNWKIFFVWIRHLIGITIILISINYYSNVPIWAYLISSYIGNAILNIRTFLEHRAHKNPLKKSVIIEDQGILAMLFLNNNFHSLHHARPHISWYKLPKLYFDNKHFYLKQNGNYLYKSYLEVFTKYLFKIKEPVAHPILKKN